MEGMPSRPKTRRTPAGIGAERVSFEIDQTVSGRFPANVIFDEDAAKVLDEQTGQETSRFYYIPKVSSKERGDSTHPTMKPIKLMEYLIKLVTPPNGVVLDPFMGSGTTGVAALRNGFEFRGIEREEQYYYISQARLEKETKDV
jgi:DNA modification methylase